MIIIKISYIVDNENWTDDEYQENCERVLTIPGHLLAEFIEDNAIDLKQSEGDEIIDIQKIEINR